MYPSLSPTISSTRCRSVGFCRVTTACGWCKLYSVSRAAVRQDQLHQHGYSITDVLCYVTVIAAATRWQIVDSNRTLSLLRHCNQCLDYCRKSEKVGLTKAIFIIIYSFIKCSIKWQCTIGEQDMQGSGRTLKAAPKLHNYDSLVHGIKTVIHKNTHT